MAAGRTDQPKFAPTGSCYAETGQQIARVRGTAGLAKESIWMKGAITPSMGGCFYMKAAVMCPQSTSGAVW